jgi:hypothetical protein
LIILKKKIFRKWIISKILLISSIFLQKDITKVKKAKINLLLKS